VRGPSPNNSICEFLPGTVPCTQGGPSRRNAGESQFAPEQLYHTIQVSIAAGSCSRFSNQWTSPLQPIHDQLGNVVRRWTRPRGCHKRALSRQVAGTPSIHLDPQRVRKIPVNASRASLWCVKFLPLYTSTARRYVFHRPLESGRSLIDSAPWSIATSVLSSALWTTSSESTVSLHEKYTC
jgi:hypothetical protein